MNKFSHLFSGVVIVASFFLFLFLYTKFVGSLPLSVHSVTTSKTDIFSVSGEGKTVVKPDIAFISVGVEASGASVKQVQNQINTTINNVTAAIKKLGIDDKDIKTVNYSIYPNYDWTSGKQKLSGYRASTTLSVKVKDLEKVNDVIDTATANGANEVGNISFDVEDRKKAESEARQQAVEEAKKKAEEAARISGFKLGKIINYQESKSDGFVPIRLGGLVAETTDVRASPETEIQPGSTEIKIIVTLSYEIE